MVLVRMVLLLVLVQVCLFSHPVCLLPAHPPLVQSTGLQDPLKGLVQSTQEGSAPVLEATGGSAEAMAMMAAWMAVIWSWLVLARLRKKSCRTFLTNQVAAAVRSGMRAPDWIMMDC